MRKINHPYIKFVNTSLWSVLSNAIDELNKNKDLIENTDHQYIVGYLCKVLSEADLILIKKPPETSFTIK